MAKAKERKVDIALNDPEIIEMSSKLVNDAVKLAIRIVATNLPLDASTRKIFSEI